MTALVRTPEIVLQSDAARLLALFLSGKRPDTVRSYQQDLSRLARFLGVEGPEKAAETLLAAGPGGANAMVMSFRNALLAEEYAPATINRVLTSLRSMVKMARLTGIATWTLEVIRVDSQAYRDTQGPGLSVINKMLIYLGTLVDRQRAARDIAIIRLLYNQGLRRGEIVELDGEHFDAKKGRLSILGKKRRERENINLSTSVVGALTAWLMVRPVKDAGPLFCSLDHNSHGQRLTGDGVLYRIRTIGNAVGEKVRPHGMRHTAITEILDRSDGNLRKAARFSRHRNLDTLQIYDDSRQDFGKEMSDLLEDK